MKKLLTKAVCAFVALVTVFCTSCSFIKPDLQEKGLEVIAVMNEMIESESYNNLFGSSLIDTSFVQNKTQEPINVYKLSDLNKDKMVEFLKAEDQEMEDYWNNLSDSLREQALERLNYLTVFNMINSKVSIECITLSSIYTATRRFKGLLKAPTAYLYVYDENISIAVVFTPGNREIVASGYFVFGELSALSIAQSIFEPCGITVENA